MNADDEIDALTVPTHAMDTNTSSDATLLAADSDNASANDSHAPHVADAAFDKDIRIIVLYVEIILGAVGGAGVFLWLWHNRRRKSRINLLILHVAVSDILVIFGACLPQLIWEYDRRWKAGVVVCKLLKFTQSFSMMASSNMLVVLSIDRMLAIRWPLRTPIGVSDIDTVVSIQDRSFVLWFYIRNFFGSIYSTFFW